MPKRAALVSLGAVVIDCMNTLHGQKRVHTKGYLRSQIVITVSCGRQARISPVQRCAVTQALTDYALSLAYKKEICETYSAFVKAIVTIAH